MDKITKKKFEEESRKLGQRELNEQDKKQLKKAGFKFELLDLFNWYRKAKVYISCRNCDRVLRKSTNLNKLKTTVKESQDYTLKNVCTICKSRLTKMLEKKKK